jgi:hypothetical protein
VFASLQHNRDQLWSAIGWTTADIQQWFLPQDSLFALFQKLGWFGSLLLGRSPLSMSSAHLACFCMFKRVFVGMSDSTSLMVSFSSVVVVDFYLASSPIAIKFSISATSLLDSLNL